MKRNIDFFYARKYINKASSSADRKLDFTLTFAEYKALCKKRRCYFTGLSISHEKNTFTLDRIDSSKGYALDNTVACHIDFNKFKSLIENKDLPLTLNNCIKGLNRWEKHK